MHTAVPLRAGLPADHNNVLLAGSRCPRAAGRRLLKVQAATGASRRSASNNGTSRRGKSNIPLNFDPELKDMAIGPMPPLPDPTYSDLEQEGLLGKDGGTPEWIK